MAEQHIEQTQEKKKKKKELTKVQKRRRRKIKKAVFSCIMLILAGMGGYVLYNRHKQTTQVSSRVTEQRTARAEKRDITSELSSSGTLAPKDTYSITSLVEGEVVLADFEEGDQVEKGQVLYRIDATSMESEIQSANNSLSRAQNTYQDAVQDYQEIQAELSENIYKATKSGYVKEVHLETGDKVGANAQICEIYDDSVMEIRLPFLSEQARWIEQGAEAVLTLTDTGENVSGIVTLVSEMDEVLTGGALVRYVLVDVENPGGLSSQNSATAQISGFLCAQEGYFSAKVDEMLVADLDYTVEVEEIFIHEGEYIAEGTPIFQITAKSAEKILKTYIDSVDRAQESVESAMNKVDSTKDSYENYTITAPISGQVITKSVKSGDNISRSGNSNTVMAVIYDLSALTFEMSIDELDIHQVKVGQKVIVTADAFEGETFSGTVTNVSLQSTASNGVTNYPVTVTMDESGDLLPGMNVDGVIILDEAKDVLSIPVDSLMRGNRVYVKETIEQPSEELEESKEESKKEEMPKQPGEQKEDREGGEGSSQERRGNDGVPEGFYAVTVETGLISDDYVEIISGLKEGDEVYVDESSQTNYNNFMMPGGGMPGGPGGGMPGGGGNRGSGGNRGGGGMR